VTALVPADPASLSALAADLLRCADRVGAARQAVAAADAQAQGSTRAVPGDDARRRSGALAAAAAALTACGRALQAYATELQHARGVALRAAAVCEHSGLRLEADGTVRLPPGPYPAVQAQVLAARVPEAQALAGRARDEAEHAARRLAARVRDPLAALSRVAVGDRPCG
jgi:hypothetical protein